MFLLLLLCYLMAAGVADLTESSFDHICYTAACYEFGHMIQNNMDNLADPCDDFYKYGCGRWAVNNPIPPNEVEISTNHIITMKTNHRIKKLLEEKSEFDELAPIKIVKQYYRTCMDEDAIEKQGLKPMQSLLNETGGLPLLKHQKRNSKNYTWQEMDNIYIEMFGKSSFFKIESILDPHNPTRFILMIDPYLQSTDKPSIRTVNKNLNEFLDYTKTTLNTIISFLTDEVVQVPLKKLQKDVKALIKFETELEEIQVQPVETDELTNFTNNFTKMTIADLQEYHNLSTNKIDWLRTIQSFFKPVKININVSEPVIVYDKYILDRLAHLLDVTSPRVIAYYVQWNIINEFIPYLNKKIRDIQFESQYSIYDVTEQDPRWKTCVQNILMEDAVSYLFIKNYTTADTLKNVSEMVEDIKKEMKMHVLHSTWANNTKEFMIDKIDNITSQIGYPEWYNNQTAFIERYKGLEIGENYFENTLAILKYEKKRNLMNFREPVDRSKWMEYPITINAFYLDVINTIVIPAAEIQDPYFTPSIPLAINYAVVGSIIGHELAHSFNPNRIYLDKFGVLRNPEKIMKVYSNRTQCFVRQYNNFTLDITNADDEPIQVNGEFTKNENIADSVGIEIAFAAFQQRKSMMGPQPKLPGLTNISDEQLFFLAYANLWCTSSRTVFEEESIETNAHSPAKFRTIGPLINMKSFSETFNCSLNSPMNLRSKCSLWK